jgi:hypothetical protein
VAIIYLVSCGNNLLNNFELWQLIIWLAVAINYLLNCGKEEKEEKRNLSKKTQTTHKNNTLVKHWLLNCGKYLSGELWQLFGGMGNKLSGEMWQ